MKNNLEERVEEIANALNEMLELIKKQNDPINVAVEEETEWKPEDGKPYYYIDLDEMAVNIDYWKDYNHDNIRFENKLVFQSKKEADKYLDYLYEKNEAMNEFSMEEWKDDDIEKYCIYYDYEYDCISFTKSLRELNTPYFRTEESAQEFIEKYEKQIRRDMGKNDGL